MNKLNAVLQGRIANERTFQFVTGSREQIIREGESMPGGEKAFVPRSAVAEHDAVSSLLSDDGDGLTFRHPHSPFYWMSHRGDNILPPTEMATQHLFYAIRMIFNNTVPPVFRVGDFKRYRDVERWNPAYKAQALMELTDAISTRLDRIVADGGLEVELQDQFDDMLQNITVILAIGI